MCHVGVFSNHFLNCSRKISACKKVLEKNLFILHPKLRPALLEVHNQCVANMETLLMAAIDPGTTYTLEEFKTCHMAKMALVRPSLLPPPPSPSPSPLFHGAMHVSCLVM